ncbi:MAG: hypothetical protein GY787_12270 [Alteromonadales bacterium]|nr:hypothetical protein [Alteromonadales bacterium]
MLPRIDSNFEEDLNSRLLADIKEYAGTPSYNADAFVKEIVDTLDNYSISETLDNTITQFAKDLSYNVEYPDYLRFSEEIIAAQRRVKGEYFLHDHWGSKINEAVSLKKFKLEMVKEVDLLLRLAPKSKPTKKWLKQLDTLIDVYGEIHIMAYIRDCLNYFVTTDKIKSNGLTYNNDNKLRAMGFVFYSYNIESDAQLLRKVLVIAYHKIPGIGAVSSAVGNTFVKALSEIKGSKGLIELNELSVKLKYPQSAKNLVKKQLEDAAKRKGVTIASLQNQLIPDFGFVD